MDPRDVPLRRPESALSEARAERRSVEVRHEDQWYPGTLDRWKHDDRGWVGYVCWSEGPGLTHVEWVKAERLRAVELLRPSDEVLERLDVVAADAAAGRDAGDPWADEDLGGC